MTKITFAYSKKKNTLVESTQSYFWYKSSSIWLFWLLFSLWRIWRWCLDQSNASE